MFSARVIREPEPDDFSQGKGVAAVTLEKQKRKKTWAFRHEGRKNYVTLQNPILLIDHYERGEREGGD